VNVLLINSTDGVFRDRLHSVGFGRPKCWNLSLKHRKFRVVHMRELIFEVVQEADGGFCAECLTESIVTEGNTWEELSPERKRGSPHRGVRLNRFRTSRFAGNRSADFCAFGQRYNDRDLLVSRPTNRRV